MTNHRRIALHLNNLATILQQLAAELVEADPPYSQQFAERVHPLQLSTEELRRQLAEPAPLPDSMYRDRGPLDDPPASVAEPECGCSLYARCDSHEFAKPRTCRCNGPDYRSSACLIEAHRQEARARPDCDPALAD